MRKMTAIAAVLVVAAVGSYRAQAPAKGPMFTTSDRITVPLRFDHYYTYEQVGEALAALHARQTRRLCRRQHTRQ
jgi:hypothetical protein